MERNVSNENVGTEKFVTAKGDVDAAMLQPAESGMPSARKFMVEHECPNLCNLMTLRYVVDDGTMVKDIEAGEDIDLCALIERAEEEFRNMVRLLNA